MKNRITLLTLCELAFQRKGGFMSVIWVGGVFVDSGTPAISAMDRGLLYGDGVFETLRTYDGKPFKPERHFDRLRRSCATMQIDVTIDDGVFEKTIAELIARNGLNDAYIRITITRGVASRFGFGPEPAIDPTIVISAIPLAPLSPGDYEKGVRLITTSIQIPPNASVPAGVKSLNAIPYIRAKQEANLAGAYDAVMLTDSGWIGECSSSNIFLVQNGALSTPSPECGILRGITRETVFMLAKERLNLTLNEGRYPKEELYRADEIFITNTSVEILPVTQIDQIAIGIGGAGPVTKTIMDSFKTLTA